VGGAQTSVCWRTKHFLAGLSAHLLQLYTKDAGKKKRGSGKGYVIGAIELSERRRRTQKALVDISTRKASKVICM
jgi:hypothetical protein